MRANIKKWQDVLMLPHTLFGLPWVIIGALLPFVLRIPATVQGVQWFSIALAFFSARFAGMALNRYIDSTIDQKNPRTRQRALPRGDVTHAEVFAVILVSLALFFFACWHINTYTLYLAPLVCTLLILYSYTKRITSLCHFVLGLIHFFGLVVAFAAVAGVMTMAPIIIATALLAIIASGDIFYALQDVDFDRSYGLYSIPVKLGVAKATLLARQLQVAAILLLLYFGVHTGLSMIYFSGCMIAASMYAVSYFQNRLVFFMNSYVGIVMMLALIGEYVWQRL